MTTCGAARGRARSSTTAARCSPDCWPGWRNGELGRTEKQQGSPRLLFRTQSGEGVSVSTNEDSAAECSGESAAWPIALEGNVHVPSYPWLLGEPRPDQRQAVKAASR